MAEPDSTKPTLDERFAEFCRQIDDGDSINRDQFIAACAADSEEAAKLLEVVDLVEQMAGPTREELGGADPEWPDDETIIGGESEWSPELSDPAEVELAFELPFQLGDFELREQIGQGGMGVVFRAWQHSMAREVAVKMIIAGRLASAEDRARFRLEARSAGGLKHPNIVKIHGVHTHQGQDFYVMELVEGCTLNEFLKDDNRIDPKTAASYVREAALAIQSAHDQGYIHRDVKPHNLMLNQRGSVRVMDFGLAKQIDSNSQLTRFDEAVGTPSYMAPEQSLGKGNTVLVDVYSLGAVLYALLAGRPPFRGENSYETISLAQTKPPPPVRTLNAKVDSDLETVCLKCLEKEPQNRYESAQELAEDLDRYLNGKTVLAKRPSRLWLQLERINTNRVAVAAMMLAIIFLLVGLLTVLQDFSSSSELHIASGQELGGYSEFAESLGQEIENQWDDVPHVENRNTEGSKENVGLVQESKWVIGFAQRDALPDVNVSVLAPLFEDIVVLVTRLNVSPWKKGVSLKLSIGSKKSGTRITAGPLIKLMENKGIKVDGVQVEFSDLKNDECLHGAIITTRLSSIRFEAFLDSRDYDLHSIPNVKEFALKNPLFVPHRIHKTDLKDNWRIGPNGIQTVKTMTYLICNSGLDSKTVRRVLGTIYEQSNLVPEHDLIRPEQMKLNEIEDLHPAARDYFEKWKKSSGLGN